MRSHKQYVPASHDTQTAAKAFCTGLNAIPLEVRPAAQSALDAIGSGMLLLVPVGDRDIRLVEGLCGPKRRADIPVPFAIALALVRSGLLHEMSENGEGQRLGWRAVGINVPPGGKVFCMVI